MRAHAALFTAFLLVGVAVALSGCGQPKAEPLAAPVAEVDDASKPAGLASLSAADREAALAQKTCPVSGQPLGSMGTPPKVRVDERDVFICCASCEAPLLDDPAKHLAKLDK